MNEFKQREKVIDRKVSKGILSVALEPPHFQHQVVFIIVCLYQILHHLETDGPIQMRV